MNGKAGVSPFTRVVVIVLDGVGIGAPPNAGLYGDHDSDTLGNMAKHVPLALPVLRSLGLDRLVSLGAAIPGPAQGAFGRMAETSAGKDSVTGHWADHGNDPSTPSTDHSREYVPVLVSGRRVRAGTDLGSRATFADFGQTIAHNFGVGPLACGTSFLENIVVEYS